MALLCDFFSKNAKNSEKGLDKGHVLCYTCHIKGYDRKSVRIKVTRREPSGGVRRWNLYAEYISRAAHRKAFSPGRLRRVHPLP